MSVPAEDTVPLAASSRRGAGAPTAPLGIIPRQQSPEVDDLDLDAAGAIAVATEAAEVDLDDAVLEAVVTLTAVEDPELDELDALAGPVVDPVAQDWQLFKSGGDRLVRERLILHYAPLVTAVAGRVGMRLPAMVEQADLVSYGMFGLIDAIEKYEPGRSVKFETYASARIRGAIIDELRAMDWIPRSVRTKARAVDRAYAELESALHRVPTESEVAARLQMDIRELRALFTQLSTVNVAALDELLGAGEDRGDRLSLLDTLGDDRTPDPENSFEAQETKFLLARAIDQLGSGRSSSWSSTTTRA
jgi:RNA polymerase sigma factor for flagellar operon FliA